MQEITTLSLKCNGCSISAEERDIQQLLSQRAPAERSLIFSGWLRRGCVLQLAQVLQVQEIMKLSLKCSGCSISAEERNIQQLLSERAPAERSLILSGWLRRSCVLQLEQVLQVQEIMKLFSYCKSCNISTYYF